MKKLPFLLIALFLLAFLTACGPKISPPDWLVGTWEGPRTTWTIDSKSAVASKGNADFPAMLNKQSGVTNYTETVSDTNYILNVYKTNRRMRYTFEKQDDGIMELKITSGPVTVPQGVFTNTAR